ASRGSFLPRRPLSVPAIPASQTHSESALICVYLRFNCFSRFSLSGPAACRPSSSGIRILSRDSRISPLSVLEENIVQAARFLRLIRQQDNHERPRGNSLSSGWG